MVVAALMRARKNAKIRKADARLLRHHERAALVAVAALRPVMRAPRASPPPDTEHSAAHVQNAGERRKTGATRARVVVQRFAGLTRAFYGAMSPQRSSRRQPRR